LTRNLVLAVTVLTASVVSAPLHAQSQPFNNTLMPAPAHLEVRSGQLVWSSTIAVGIPHFRDARLDAALDRTLLEIQQQTGVPRPQEINTSATATLVLDVAAAGESIQSVDEDESYTLTVTSSSATIHANTVVGAIRGLTTLAQLVQPGASGYILPAVAIEDSPRFRWRGLMIDTGRHFEPIDVIKRNLDAMAAVKLNVFHWHLTEDQGFRIESKIFPKLTGGGSDGLFYTQAQVRDVIAYARARGIRVVPEFDIPGHTRSWFVGYPALASAKESYNIRRQFGIDDAAMDPTRESTYLFLDKFLGEMAELFPDPYMHVGGDESNGKQWKANPSIQTFMRAHHIADNAALQTYFSQRVLKILTKHHKHMVGWDEILNPALPPDAIIQSWRGQQSLFDAARQGHQAILSQPYYLDGMKSAETHYLADPIPSTAGLNPEQEKLILGGEACMWGEHISERSIDSRIWPRTAAVAERFWSPASNTNVADMYRRLAVESIRLEALGLTHLSHTEAALRDLAGTSNIDALRTFAGVLEPVSFGERYRAQRTDQRTPLDNLVDAVQPDPPSRYQIATQAQEFLASPTSATEAHEQLAAAFRSWIAAVPTVESQMKTSPRLAEARPRAEELDKLAKTGLEALNYLAQDTKAPAGWKQAKLAEIEEAKRPQALVRFTFLPALTDLINAVQ
jgi:hexosaminidase